MIISPDQIKEIVKAGVHDVLPSAKISRVEVQEDVDSRDDPALVIMVVFPKRRNLKGEDFFLCI